MTTAMALPMCLKRPAEEYPDSPPSPNSEGVSQSSHVKVYNSAPTTVSAATQNTNSSGRAKRRKGDPLYLNNLGVFTDVDSESGESREETEHDVEFTKDYPKENEPVLSKEDALAKEEYINGNGSGPTVNGNRGGFPCVWMDGTSPGRNTEGGDKSPNPVPQALPMEGANVPAEIPKPVVIQPQIPAKEPSVARRPPSSNKPNPSAMNSRISKLIGAENGSHSDGESPTDSDGNSVEVCPECHKVFKRKVYLQRHMEREHWSTAKVFKCEDCSYETKHQSNLSVHRRTHTGERPYHCGACGQRYTQGHLLKSHIRSRHGGNMEFYNLEKKSESTRGRKSLDMKHEMLLGGNQKQDKISALLQAVSSQSSPQPQAQIPPKFGNLLSPTMSMSNYMNTMSPFFNQLRPMMAPLGNRLLGPNFFALGGMPNGLATHAGQMLPATMQQSLNLLNGQSLAASLGMTQQDISPNKEAQPESPDSNGIKIPLKIPEVQTAPSYPPVSLAAAAPPAAVAPIKREEVGLPQDLTTKRPDSRDSLSPPKLSAAESLNLSRHTSRMREEPEDLSSPKPPPMVRECNPPEPRAAEAVPKAREVLPPRERPAKPSPAHAQTAEVTCNGCDCQHLRQLKTLRKNVFRMLSVFTPDLSRDNSIDFETDEVDELLHEVIYSNIDDDCFKPKND